MDARELHRELKVWLEAEMLSGRMSATMMARSWQLLDYIRKRSEKQSKVEALLSENASLKRRINSGVGE